MKIILVDAWNTFIKDKKIDSTIYKLLEGFKNKKIILTNANEQELVNYGIINMPYEVFSLSHKPNKDNPFYFKSLIKKYNLFINDLIYIEHNKEAVKSAESLGIKTYHYNPMESTDKLSKFLLNSL
jgi:FMN phosphatase YigB (HAD superfamily)